MPEGTIKTSLNERRSQLAKDRFKIRQDIQELCNATAPHYDLNVSLMYEGNVQKASEGILRLSQSHGDHD